MDDVKTREQELLEEFKAGLEPDAAPQLAARIAALEAERDDRQAALEAAHADNDGLKTRIAEAEKAAKASVSRGEKPASPRKLKVIDPEDNLKGDDLRDALKKADDAGKSVQIAFSDGTREIAGVPPIDVVGDVWRDHSRGLMLRDAVTVEGPAPGAAPVGIEGYALLIDGKQVAYCQRSEPVRVAPGTRVSLSDDIWF